MVANLLIVAKIWKHPKSPGIGEVTKEMVAHIYQEINISHSALAILSLSLKYDSAVLRGHQDDNSKCPRDGPRYQTQGFTCARQVLQIWRYLASPQSFILSQLILVNQ